MREEEKEGNWRIGGKGGYKEDWWRRGKETVVPGFGPSIER
jgi:hypothetical protein